MRLSKIIYNVREPSIDHLWSILAGAVSRAKSIRFAEATLVPRVYGRSLGFDRGVVLRRPEGELCLLLNIPSRPSRPAEMRPLDNGRANPNGKMSSRGEQIKQAHGFCCNCPNVRLIHDLSP
jgi:hypothetical protein